ncbi:MULTISPECIES: hypothetical protein [unclassified Sporosarcina]|uniref:hypothetical protein n=1 Tax=unclassified Sporosarcina TaxID=2647733 RepID=UPI0020400D90|nr:MULTISPECIES: hypothetical protein [unclassified Sporosarcina]GKV65712.1 hypothetical protein NCCP2331_18650 [Sporosarcina sp. NCCP-2331]GLB55836.1 hypothetical protein NCCP2378_16230 [Sporosarcina sp. NCCP-2378]
MNFRRSYSKFTVIRAMIQGVGIGLAAILVIGLTIFSTGGKGAAPDKTVTTSGPGTENGEDEKAADGEAITMFVKQHGVFSSKESAADFAAENPSLANTSIVQVSDQFYIWGAVWLEESQVVLKEGEDAFKKKIQLAPGTCKTADSKQVEKALFADDLSKIDLSKDQKEKKESDLQKKITAISAFTKDSSIARLHLLAHYTSQDPCFKIQF